MAAIIALLISGCLFALFNQTSDVYEDGRVLGRKFYALGNMSGMTKNEIIAGTREPNAISNLSFGQLLQWQETGYHLCILFDFDGNFIEITSQYSARK